MMSWREALPGWKPYLGLEPSRNNSVGGKVISNPYPGVWNWDAAFHAIALSHWGGGLAREHFAILFSHQLPNGELPNVIHPDGTMFTSVTKPPVMAWAIAVVDRRSPDTTFLREIYPKLVRLGNFWLKERGGERDGLFCNAGSDVSFDSGWDDSIRFDDGYRKAQSDNHRLWAIDLNCYMVMHYRAMAYISGRLGLSSDTIRWNDSATQLAQHINQKLWKDKLGFYVDRDRITGKDGPALSPAGFMPLFAGIATPAGKVGADSGVR